MREYNESLELQRYVWQFLVRLMSSEEQLVEKEWHAQQHRGFGQTHVAEFLNKRHGLDASMEVQKVRRIGSIPTPSIFVNDCNVTNQMNFTFIDAANAIESYSHQLHNSVSGAEPIGINQAVSERPY